MKKTSDLLIKAVEMGFNWNEALDSIDKALDEEFGFENRKPIGEEELTDELYDKIIFRFESDIGDKK